jgi:hypothetical protein
VKFKKRKYYFMINTENLGLATGDLNVNTFDLGAPFLCLPPCDSYLGG